MHCSLDRIRYIRCYNYFLIFCFYFSKFVPWMYYFFENGSKTEFHVPSLCCLVIIFFSPRASSESWVHADRQEQPAAGTQPRARISPTLTFIQAWDQGQGWSHLYLAVAELQPGFKPPVVYSILKASGQRYHSISSLIDLISPKQYGNCPPFKRVRNLKGPTIPSFRWN